MSLSASPSYEVVLRDPELVLRQQLGDDLVVESFESTPLVKPGENYGSTILKVSVRVRRGRDAKPEELELVAKMLPPTDFQRELFESVLTFKKEIFMYEDLLPTYAALYGGPFDVAPRYYGSRLSIKPGADIDDDVLIFLENLKARGYYMENRHKGLDLTHVKMALSSLAKFHVVGIAIKYKKPSYLSKLQEYAKPLSINDSVISIFQHEMVDGVKNDPQVKQHYEKVMRTGNVHQPSKTYRNVLDPKDPWACLVHNDFWLNNALFHKDEEGNLDDAKIVDFQMCFMGSPLTDLIFFLCTSMQPALEQFDEMLEFYRKEASAILKRLDCDVDLFSKEQFEQRLKVDAPGELFHILLMIKVIELREGEIYDRSPLNEFCMRRVRNVVNVYVNKKWI